MKIILPVLVALLAFAAPAHAEDGLSIFMGNVVYPLLAAALSMGLLVLAAKLSAQFPAVGKLIETAVHTLLVYRGKVQADQRYTQEQYYSVLANEAVAMVEERSAATIKRGGEKLASGSKFAMAVNALMSAAPEIPKQRAEQLVDAAVAWMDGTGATDESVR